MVNSNNAQNDTGSSEVTDNFRNISQAGEEMQKDLLSVDSIIEASLNGLTGVVTNFFNSFSAKEAISQIIRIDSQLDRTQINFEHLTHSASGAKQAIEDVYSMKSPFDVDSLIKAEKAMLNMNMSVGESTRTVKILSDTITGLGGTSEDLEGIIGVYTHSLSKGKLYTEDLLKFSERSVPVWQILSQETGKSKAQLVEMAENGQLVASTYLPKILGGLEKRFKGAGEEYGNTLDGANERIKNSLKLLTKGTTDNIFDKLKSCAVSLADYLEDAKASGKMTAWANLMKHAADGVLEKLEAIHKRFSKIFKNKQDEQNFWEFMFTPEAMKVLNIGTGGRDKFGVPKYIDTMTSDERQDSIKKLEKESSTIGVDLTSYVTKRYNGKVEKNAKFDSYLRDLGINEQSYDFITHNMTGTSLKSVLNKLKKNLPKIEEEYAAALDRLYSAGTPDYAGFFQIEHAQQTKLEQDYDPNAEEAKKRALEEAARRRAEAEEAAKREALSKLEIDTNKKLGQIDIDVENVNFKRQTNQLSEKASTEALIKLSGQRYNVEKDALAKKLAIVSKDASESAAVKKEQADLDRKHNLENIQNKNKLSLLEYQERQQLDSIAKEKEKINALNADDVKEAELKQKFNLGEMDQVSYLQQELSIIKEKAHINQASIQDAIKTANQQKDTVKVRELENQLLQQRIQDNNQIKQQEYAIAIAIKEQEKARKELAFTTDQMAAEVSGNKHDELKVKRDKAIYDAKTSHDEAYKKASGWTEKWEIDLQYRLAEERANKEYADGEGELNDQELQNQIAHNNALARINNESKESLAKKNREVIDKEIKNYQTLLAKAKDLKLTDEQRLAIEQKLADATEQQKNTPTSLKESVKSGIGNWKANMKDSFVSVSDMSKDCADSIQNNLSDAFSGLFKGEFGSFKDRWKNLWQDIGNSMIKTVSDSLSQMLTNQLMDWLMSLLPGGGGQRANGGSTLAGTTYLVGERGPELLVMGDTNGYVVPNHKLSGSAGANVTVNVVNNSGQQLNVKQEKQVNGQDVVVSMVIDAVHRNVNGVTDILRQRLAY